MKKHIVIIAILILNNSYSQTKKSKNDFFETTALQTGYLYLGKNYGYIGFDKRINNPGDWAFANIGIGTNVSYFENKIQFVPEIHTNITYILLLAEIPATTKGVNPSLGINIMNRVMIKSGYNFAYKNEDFRGITFGININFGFEDYHYMTPLNFL
jgi:hypothetical protein